MKIDAHTMKQVVDFARNPWDLECMVLKRLARNWKGLLDIDHLTCIQKNAAECGEAVTVVGDDVVALFSRTVESFEIKNDGGAPLLSDLEDAGADAGDPVE